MLSIFHSQTASGSFFPKTIDTSCGPMVSRAFEIILVRFTKFQLHFAVDKVTVVTCSPSNV